MVPEVLGRWLSEHGHQVSWFLDMMLGNTYMMRSDADAVDGQWNTDSVYVTAAL